MRCLPLAALVFATLPEVAAAPVPKHLMKDESYWPTAVGTKWEYDQKEFTFTEEITKAEPIKGGVRLTVRVRRNGEDDDIYDVGPAGVINRTSGPWVLGTRLLRFPVKSGDTWTFAIPIQKGTVGCECSKPLPQARSNKENPMRTFMGCLLLVAFGGLLGADDKKDEKIDAKLLVGKWKPKEKAHFTEMEFRKGDDVTFTFLIKEKEEKVSNKYKLDGNRLVVTEEVGGVKSSVKSRILKLTETELVMVDEKNKQIAFVRAKGK